jgi:DNA (cytosine-5)-methyltransferase 1
VANRQLVKPLLLMDIGLNIAHLSGTVIRLTTPFLEHASHPEVRPPMSERLVTAVDLFCGAGGLTYGLQRAGIAVIAGIDVDPVCEYAYVSNNGCLFIQADVREVGPEDVELLYPAGSIRLLAGCAPCRPFSRLGRRGKRAKSSEWGLLTEFSRLIEGVRPEFVTMENVPSLGSKRIFGSFVSSLRRLGYNVDYKSVHCPRLGLPQNRRRLVLLASLLGPIRVPAGSRPERDFRTVRSAIGSLRPIPAGGRDTRDRLHKARSLSTTNLMRLRRSTPGGTWHDWPADLRTACHRREKGATYRSVYARMEWDRPAPTITTQAHNFGTGRFGHPDQDRAISLREAAILQTFPSHYRFVGPRDKAPFATIGRLIGNAVPPRLAEAVGREILRVVAASSKKRGST